MKRENGSALEKSVGRGLLFLLALSLILGGCAKLPKRVLLSIPQRKAEGIYKQVFLQVFAYWGSNLTESELSDALKSGWKPSNFAQVAKRHNLELNFLLLDLKTIKKLIGHNFPIIGYSIRDFIDPFKGIAGYERGFFLVMGYDESKKVFYVWNSLNNKADEVPYSVADLSWWKGRGEGEIFLIFPKEKQELVKKLVPSDAFQKGKEIAHIINDEESGRMAEKMDYEEKAREARYLMDERMRLVKEYPSWAYAYYLAGYPLFMIEGKEEGLRMLEKAERMASSPFYSLALASAYATQGRYEEAVRKIKGFYKLTGNKGTLSLDFLNVYLLVKMGKFETAESWLNTLLSKPSSFEETFHTLNLLLKFEEGKVEDAFNEAKILAKNYDNLYDYRVLLSLYRYFRKRKEAEEVYNEARKRFGKEKYAQPDLQRMELQLRLDNARDLNEKIRIAQELPKIEREFTLLEIYLEHKRWDEAEKLMASSEFFDPKFWLVCFPWEAMYGPPYAYKFTALLFSVKGVIAYHKGDKSKARELFEEALKLYKKPLSLFTPFGADGVLTPKAYLGMIYQEEGREELARKYLKEAFSKNVPFLVDDEAKPVAQKLGISVR
jgi:hypothetical protein